MPRQFKLSSGQGHRASSIALANMNAQIYELFRESSHCPTCDFDGDGWVAK